MALTAGAGVARATCGQELQACIFQANAEYDACNQYYNQSTAYCMDIHDHAEDACYANYEECY